MIKAIIFDMGGVLIDLDFNGCLENFRTTLGYENIVNLLDCSAQRGIYGLLEEGILSEEDFKSEIIKGSKPGVTSEDIDWAVGTLLVGMEPYKVPLLKKLKQKYPLYMLSNNNPISMKRSRKLFLEAGIDETTFFEKEFLSYQMKVLKPSAQIYNEVIRQIGCKPEEALFIDDSVKNIEGAKACGITTLLYNQGDDLVSALSQVLGEDLSC